MALPTVENALKVTFRATLEDSGGPVEEAQFGFTGIRYHRVGNNVNWSDDLDELAVKLRDAWNSKVTTKTLWSAAVRMATVRVDHLDATTGKTAEVGIAPFTNSDAWYGSASDSLPWETTVAVSLYGYDEGEFVTNKARKRGRFYLPPLAAGMSSGYAGQMTQGAVSGLTTQIVAFLNEAQGAEIGSDFDSPSGADYFDLRVLSRGTPLKPLDPTSTQIKRVRIDTRIDSQRRRERQQPILGYGQGTVEHAD